MTWSLGGIAQASNGGGRAAVALALALGVAPSISAAREGGDSHPPAWSGAAQAYLYFLPDDTFATPVAVANRGALHLEARWNYEDRDTFSGWVGWTFTFGEELQLELVPMVGAIVGRTDGMAPGLELTLAWKRLELYSESEHVISLAGPEDDFFYDWSQLGCRVFAGLQVGLAAQRTQLYESEFELARGPFLAWEQGGGVLGVYGFDLDGEDPFVVLTLAVGF